MVEYPVKFRPIAMERLWGGHELVEKFGDNFDQPIGEYWVLSGHPNGTSVVSNGALQGTSLVELTEKYPAYLGQSPQQRFPLMIKFLEANSDLSVQIHPDDQYALAHEGDYGKTEAWYVLKAKQNGQVIYGHTFANQSQYLDAVAHGSVKSFLSYQPVQERDLVFVPAHTLHALLAGTQVIEVQQTSDVTYRVYDWDRVDQFGKPRELHVRKAGEVMQYGDVLANEPSYAHSLSDGDGIDHRQLVSCPYFTMDVVNLTLTEYTLTQGKEGNPDIVIVAFGHGTLTYHLSDGTKDALTLAFGDTVLIPSTVSSYVLQTDTELNLIRAYY